MNHDVLSGLCYAKGSACVPIKALVALFALQDTLHDVGRVEPGRLEESGIGAWSARLFVARSADGFTYRLRTWSSLPAQFCAVTGSSAPGRLRQFSAGGRKQLGSGQHCEV